MLKIFYIYIMLVSSNFMDWTLGLVISVLLLPHLYNLVLYTLPAFFVFCFGNSCSLPLHFRYLLSIEIEKEEPFLSILE